MFSAYQHYVRYNGHNPCSNIGHVDGGNLMPDYAKMYHTLFNAVTESIEILQRAQQDTEDMYILEQLSEITSAEFQSHKSPLYSLSVVK